MRIRRRGEKAQQAHIRGLKDFAPFLCQLPDTATSEELRAYQLYMTDAGVTPSTFNARIVIKSESEPLLDADMGYQLDAD